MEVLFFSLSLVFIFALSGYLVRLSNGSSPNPFKWAQERRDEANMARLDRIKALEHDLGYRPCSDDKCFSCRQYRKGHPIWDNAFLPAPPPMDMTAMVKQAYDKQVSLADPEITGYLIK